MAKTKPIPLAKLLDEYEAYSLADAALRTVQVRRAPFRFWKDMYGDKRASELTVADVDAAMDKMATTHATATREQYWVALRVAIAWAVRTGLLEKNPLPGLEVTAGPERVQKVPVLFGKEYPTLRLSSLASTHRASDNPVKRNKGPKLTEKEKALAGTKRTRQKAKEVKVSPIVLEQLQELAAKRAAKRLRAAATKRRKK